MSLITTIKQHLKGSTLLYLLLFTVAASLASCDKQEPYDPYRQNRICFPTQDEKDAQKIVDIKLIKRYFREKNIDTTNVVEAPSGIHYFVKTAGTGDQIMAGDRVEVHYIGKHLDGDSFDKSTSFDNSYSRAKPFSVLVGNDKVIEGWHQGLQLMKVGETGLLYIPSYLAYGPCGSGSIFPNEVLSFEIQVLRKL